MGGGLSLGLKNGEVVSIGDDIKIIVQRNNSSGSTSWQLRIQAPKEIKITREGQYDEPNGNRA